MAVMKFSVVRDFSRLAVTDWRLRRWPLCFLALRTATRCVAFKLEKSRYVGFC